MPMTDAELCREVAEKVMGWSVDDTGQLVNEEASEGYPAYDELELSWSDAGRVVERMMELDFLLTMVVVPPSAQGQPELAGKTVAYFQAYDVPDPPEALSESSPRAVFEAALKAVEARDVS